MPNADASSPNLVRCRWAGTDKLMVAYHDKEWGVPERNSRKLWETLMLEGFQAGLSWSTILNKRRRVPQSVRRVRSGEGSREFGARDIRRLLGDPGIVRSRAKIEATDWRRENLLRHARARREVLDLLLVVHRRQADRGRRQDGAGHRRRCRRRFPKELKRRGFKFVGPTIVYAWMQAVGIVNDHSAQCFRRGASK